MDYDTLTEFIVKNQSKDWNKVGKMFLVVIAGLKDEPKMWFTLYLMENAI